MNIKELLDICIDKNLIDMTISSRKLKDETKAQKVKIRPVIIKDTLEYQVSEFVGRKVLHTNYTQKDVKKRIEKYMEEEFKQAQITRTDSLATILSSKSGTCTCKYKKAKEIKAQKELSHNRTKKYIIQEGTPVGFMIDLGVMTPDGYDRLDFYVGDIATYKDVDSVDMVVTLHACDTATDYALAKAVAWGAKVILSVPCCQHEANRTISSTLLSPVMDYGILKERMSAIITDAARANMLKARGYDTQILEFIDMEHTPKNLLIRAVKTGKTDEKAEKQAEDMQKALGIELTISKLL